MTDRSKFAKNTVFQYLLQIAKYLFPFITIPYLTRVLGPDVYAVRAYILAAMTFMQVLLDFGFISYGTRAIAKALDMQEQNIETSAITYLRLALCVVGALILVPITAAIPIMATNVLYVVFAYLAACFKALLPDFVFQGLEDMGIITYRFVVSEAVALALIFLLVRGPEDLLWVAVLEGLAALIALVWSWANVLGKRGYRFVGVAKAKLVHALRESWIFFVASASSTVLSTLTTLLIGIYIPDAAVISYWSIAMTAIVAVQSLYAPITNSLYPHMVKRRDFSLFKKLMLIGNPVNLVGTVAFALLADVIMLILGGPEYMDGAYLIALVAPMLAFSFPAVMLGYPVLAAVGQSRRLMVTSIVAAVFQIAVMVVLVAMGAFTIEALAILRCVAEFVLMLTRAIFVWRFSRGCYGDEETA